MRLVPTFAIGLIFLQSVGCKHVSPRTCDSHQVVRVWPAANFEGIAIIALVGDDTKISNGAVIDVPDAEASDVAIQFAIANAFRGDIRLKVGTRLDPSGTWPPTCKCPKFPRRKRLPGWQMQVLLTDDRPTECNRRSPAHLIGTNGGVAPKTLNANLPGGNNQSSEIELSYDAKNPSSPLTYSLHRFDQRPSNSFIGQRIAPRRVKHPTADRRSQSMERGQNLPSPDFPQFIHLLEGRSRPINERGPGVV